MTSKNKQWIEGKHNQQAQSATTTTTTGEVKLWSIPLIDTFMKRLLVK
jgi:hypothetical protein